MTDFMARPFFDSFNASERQVLSTILKKGPVTQAVISKECNLKQQSISRIISSLLTRRLVKSEVKVNEGKRGQSSQAFELVDDYAYSIGVAIMVDTVSLVVMDLTGTVKFAEALPVDTNTPDVVVEIVEKRLVAWETDKLVDRARICGIGIALTGYFIEEDDTFNTPETLPEWAFVNVKKLFSDKFNLPAWADNDGNTAAIGESLVGAGKWAQNFAYLYLSGGFGGGIIVNGKLHRGNLGNAGEFAGILPYNIYAHPTIELLRQSICRHGVQLDSVYETVTDFDINWPGVKDWILKTKDSFSLVASAVSAILDNDAIVIGGRIPKELAEELIPYIQFYSMERRGVRRPVPKIISSEVDGEATAIGAASLPFSNLFF